MRVYKSIIGSLAFAVLLSAVVPAQAEDYRVKYTYDTSTNKVLTNVDSSNAFPDAVMGRPKGKSTYMQKAKARRQAAKKQSAGAKSNGDVSAVPSKTASAASAPARSTAKAPSGRTIVKRTADKLKIRTEEKDILPAPTFEYAVSGYEYAGDTWAFATFDARKRSPRIVRYYGWHDDGSGAQVQGWYNVDLNPLILQASKDAGVDPLLVEIVMRYESNFNPYARSPVGAVGLMQLMPDTASGLGISDVYDVRDNIRGGAQYIAYQLARFNSVPLALAAYNAGPGAVLEYGGVPPYAETQYYVRTIYGEYQAGLRYRQQHR